MSEDFSETQEGYDPDLTLHYERLKEEMRKCKFDIEEVFKRNDREFKHILVASMILETKTESRRTYAELANDYGVLSTETIKSLALRRVYLSDKQLESFFDWLLEETILESIAKVSKGAAKDIYSEIFSTLDELEGG